MQPGPLLLGPSLLASDLDKESERMAICPLLSSSGLGLLWMPCQKGCPFLSGQDIAPWCQGPEE